jgi:hypothetical protein
MEGRDRTHASACEAKASKWDFFPEKKEDHGRLGGFVQNMPVHFMSHRSAFYSRVASFSSFLAVDFFH